MHRLVRARAGESGIVYCLSRKATESTARYLVEKGIRADAYHAGLPAEQRSKVQDAFRDDELDVVVATIAFGMGIDKSNVRYVIHRDMPRSIEGYYQEIGRAGRDGVDSDCVLFYSWAEVRAYDVFADSAPEDVEERLREQAREMFRMADAVTCRHQALAAYFGEHMEPCGSSCDVCARADVLAEAKASATPRRRKRKVPARRALDSLAVDVDGGDEVPEIFDRLRALRKEIARAEGVPAYVVFTDAALIEMALRRPTTPEELREVPGVGPKRCARFGDPFLDLLRDA